MDKYQVIFSGGNTIRKQNSLGYFLFFDDRHKAINHARCLCDRRDFDDITVEVMKNGLPKFICKKESKIVAIESKVTERFI